MLGKPRRVVTPEIIAKCVPFFETNRSWYVFLADFMHARVEFNGEMQDFYRSEITLAMDKIISFEEMEFVKQASILTLLEKSVHGMIEINVYLISVYKACDHTRLICDVCSVNLPPELDKIPVLENKRYSVFVKPELQNRGTLMARVPLPFTNPYVTVDPMYIWQTPNLVPVNSVYFGGTGKSTMIKKVPPEEPDFRFNQYLMPKLNDWIKWRERKKMLNMNRQTGRISKSYSKAAEIVRNVASDIIEKQYGGIRPTPLSSRVTKSCSGEGSSNQQEEMELGEDEQPSVTDTATLKKRINETKERVQALNSDRDNANRGDQQMSQSRSPNRTADADFPGSGTSPKENKVLTGGLVSEVDDGLAVVQNFNGSGELTVRNDQLEDQSVSLNKTTMADSPHSENVRELQEASADDIHTSADISRAMLLQILGTPNEKPSTSRFPPVWPLFPAHDYIISQAVREQDRQTRAQASGVPQKIKNVRFKTDPDFTRDDTNVRNFVNFSKSVSDLNAPKTKKFAPGFDDEVQPEIAFEQSLWSGKFSVSQMKKPIIKPKEKIKGRAKKAKLKKFHEDTKSSQNPSNSNLPANDKMKGALVQQEELMECEEPPNNFRAPGSKAQFTSRQQEAHDRQEKPPRESILSLADLTEEKFMRNPRSKSVEKLLTALFATPEDPTPSIKVLNCKMPEEFEKLLDNMDTIPKNTSLLDYFDEIEINPRDEQSSSASGSHSSETGRTTSGTIVESSIVSHEPFVSNFASPSPPPVLLSTSGVFSGKPVPPSMGEKDLKPEMSSSKHSTKQASKAPLASASTSPREAPELPTLFESRRRSESASHSKSRDSSSSSVSNEMRRKRPVENVKPDLLQMKSKLTSKDSDNHQKFSAEESEKPSNCSKYSSAAGLIPPPKPPRSQPNTVVMPGKPETSSASGNKIPQQSPFRTTLTNTEQEPQFKIPVLDPRRARKHSETITTGKNRNGEPYSKDAKLQSSHNRMSRSHSSSHGESSSASRDSSTRSSDRRSSLNAIERQQTPQEDVKPDISLLQQVEASTRSESKSSGKNRNISPSSRKRSSSSQDTPSRKSSGSQERHKPQDEDVKPKVSMLKNESRSNTTHSKRSDKNQTPPLERTAKSANTSDGSPAPPVNAPPKPPRISSTSGAIFDKPTSSTITKNSSTKFSDDVVSKTVERHKSLMEELKSDLSRFKNKQPLSSFQTKSSENDDMSYLPYSDKTTSSSDVTAKRASSSSRPKTPVQDSEADVSLVKNEPNPSVFHSKYAEKQQKLAEALSTLSESSSLQSPPKLPVVPLSSKPSTLPREEPGRKRPKRPENDSAETRRSTESVTSSDSQSEESKNKEVFKKKVSEVTEFVSNQFKLSKTLMEILNGFIREEEKTFYSSHFEMNKMFEDKIFKMFHATMYTMDPDYNPRKKGKAERALSAEIATWSTVRFIAHVGDVVQVFTTSDNFLQAMQNEPFVESLEKFFGVIRGKSVDMMKKKEIRIEREREKRRQEKQQKEIKQHEPRPQEPRPWGAGKSRQGGSRSSGPRS